MSRLLNHIINGFKRRAEVHHSQGRFPYQHEERPCVVTDLKFLLNAFDRSHFSAHNTRQGYEKLSIRVTALHVLGESNGSSQLYPTRIAQSWRQAVGRRALTHSVEWATIEGNERPYRLEWNGLSQISVRRISFTHQNFIPVGEKKLLLFASPSDLAMTAGP